MPRYSEPEPDFYYEPYPDDEPEEPDEPEEKEIDPADDDRAIDRLT